MTFSRQSLYSALSITIALAIISASTILHLITEHWWFQAVGFESVFTTRLLWPIALGIGSFLLYGLALGINYSIAAQSTQDLTVLYIRSKKQLLAVPNVSPWIGISLVGFLSFSAAVSTSSQWETALRFLNRQPFDQIDPIFNRDISFYIFDLPFYQSLHGLGLSVLGGSFILSLLIYGIKGAITLNKSWDNLMRYAVKVHLSVLGFLLALVVAWGFWLQRFEILYSPTGVVFGAGYTDANARLQSYDLMLVLTLGLGLVFVLTLWRKTLLLAAGAIVLYGASIIMVLGVYPSLQQQLVVEPNELAREKPYISHNLEFTRHAYQLDQVQNQSYPVQNDLTAADLSRNQDTLNNIRLWDYGPLLNTYQQLQELRLYYHFQNVDVDRYTLDGRDRQVMLSAREMDASRLPSPSWVNERLKYTHGYGLAMSPVDQVTRDGLPELIIKDVPPVLKGGLSLAQPAIYYGELTNNYIFTGTTTDEFDYPLGNDNAAVRYGGTGGVPMPTLGHRLAYALDLSSLKILISQYFTPESRIHYYRQIDQRVQHIAPFLQFDQDPYLVLVNDRLQWVFDAYTVSDRYPYSEPIALMPGADRIVHQPWGKRLINDRINYLRNSVKVVVDAYDGNVTFYAIDETDPVLKVYRQAFPDLFASPETIPPELLAHFRYPRDLFSIQALLYLAYHMENPEVFYNQEDLWSFPQEIYEGNQPVISEPYYLILRLPGDTPGSFLDPDMLLISPFTPVNKDNMIAWMAARSPASKTPDGQRLFLYEFPKQELVYGPSQIEARVDQTPEISQQLTLWSQQGSRVIRGSLLVIPLERSLLYVEPIYLRAEQGELPELRRVIVAYGDRVVMEPTLNAALQSIFGETPPQASTAPANSEEPTSPPNRLPETVTNLVDTAVDTYNKAQAALQAGNWADYGRYQQELADILKQLDTQTSDPATLPQSSP